MSDMSMYELDDIIWDDFDQGDDHIVPHPTNARTSRNSFERDNCKKFRRETTPILSNSGNLGVSNTVYQGITETDSKPLDKKTNMMEKEILSHRPPAVFRSSSDGEIVKDIPNLASDDTRMSRSCFKISHVTSGADSGVGDHVLSGTSAAGDNKSYSYPLTHISQEGDLCFVDNNCEDKGSSDLLYYGWPDIENFEDVDQLIRSCDSSFGLGVTNNDTELGWYTSDRLEGSEEASSFNFPCPKPSDLKNILMNHDSSESNNHKISCISESKDELNYRNQKKQSKNQSQMEGNKVGQGVGNDDSSLYQISDLTSNDSRLSSRNKFDQVFTSLGNRQQYRNLEPDFSGHMPSNTSYLPPSYSHQTTPGPMESGITSEHKDLKAPCLMEFSYASNQGYSMGSAAEVDVQNQEGNLQGFQPLPIGCPRQTGMMFQSSKSILLSTENQVHGNELEKQSDMEGVEKRDDVGLSNGSASSLIGSDLDQMSLESTCFRQLRQIMEQLDLRTKLCIRDSLYRLARSAEQRHNNPGLNSAATDMNDIGGPIIADRSDKCTGFMDMETDTNPIDRSVAHLLFHRPSESPNLPAPLSPKPNLKQGSMPGPSRMTEKIVRQEELAAESNDKTGGNEIRL
uniref:protein LNK1 n=1 Tax=Erigeron canadensis TaxID=72917 RepID=UPI001CB93819|nr:protein LNK1 [Erigeron canadensis]